MRKQRTLASSFSLQGKGLHSGLEIHITFLPAPENHGYKIRRVDLPETPLIDALAENVGNTLRGTVLVRDGVQVSTVEHAMAALYAAEIDNCLIEVDAPEFPILDGSAAPFFEGIRQAGAVEQDAVREYYVIKQRIEVRDEATGASIVLLPDEGFSVNALISRFPYPQQPVRHLGQFTRFRHGDSCLPHLRFRSRSGRLAAKQPHQGRRPR